MKTLKAKALLELNSIEINTYEDICDSIVSLSQNNLFIEAKKLLLSQTALLNKQGLVNDDSLFLLFKSMSKYLYYLSISSLNHSLKDEVKGLIKQIRIILKYLETNYDEHFLLIKNQDIFLAIENALFLNSVDDISTVLNHSNFIKEADRFFILKSKVELGFNRYLFNQKNKILLAEFSREGNFKFLGVKSKLQILNEYFSDEILFKNLETENIILNSSEFEEKLLYLKLLKTRNKLKFQKEFNKLKKFLRDFPEFIWDVDYFNIYENLVKSINKDKEIQCKKVEKNKLLVNYNHIKTINLIIQLLKNE